MIDLPKIFPMYCKDLKQYYDDLGNGKQKPKLINEHDALSDAIWNYELYKILKI